MFTVQLKNKDEILKRYDHLADQIEKNQTNMYKMIAFDAAGQLNKDITAGAKGRKNWKSITTMAKILRSKTSVKWQTWNAVERFNSYNTLIDTGRSKRLATFGNPRQKISSGKVHVSDYNKLLKNRADGDRGSNQIRITKNGLSMVVNGGLADHDKGFNKTFSLTSKQRSNIRKHTYSYNQIRPNVKGKGKAAYAKHIWDSKVEAIYKSKRGTNYHIPARQWGLNSTIAHSRFGLIFNTMLEKILRGQKIR